jgi:hypothetical protein
VYQDLGIGYAGGCGQAWVAARVGYQEAGRITTRLGPMAVRDTIIYISYFRHCEERSDAGIQSLATNFTAKGSGLIRSARNDDVAGSRTQGRHDV